MNKRYRLRNNADFEKVYKYGKSFANKYLVIKFRKVNYTKLRIGFSISRKYGNAVKRNKIRRQLKDIAQRRINTLKSGLDIVFLVRAEASAATYTELENSFENLLKRAKIIEDI